MAARLSKTELDSLIREQQTAAVIINARSRNGARIGQRAYRALRAAGLVVPMTAFVRNPYYVERKVCEAVDRGLPYIIIGGGDGTVSSVTRDFAFRSHVLGVLPLGTGNSFAHSLGIPPGLPGALEVLLHGRVEDIDLGRVGDDYFANIVDMGMSAEMAWLTSGTLKRYLGILAYLIVGARLLFRHRAFTARFIDEHGAERTFRTHEVIVANGRFYGETMLDDTATVESHHLSVFTMETVNRRALAWLWLRFMLTRRASLKEISSFNTNAVEIITDPPQYIDLDGEATRRTPARFTVAPNALYVMVPQGFNGHPAVAA